MTAQTTLAQRVARLIRQQPIILAWFGCFSVGCALNFTMGLQLFGFWTGFAFVCVAIVGAYCAHEFGRSSGIEKTAQVVIAVLCFGLGQWCGWQQLGLRMATGLTTLTSQASGHNTAADALAAARAERAKLGNQRPVAAIDAELALEERKTSRNCPDGRCGKWTILKTEQANAQRAAELDAKLPEMAAALKAGDQVSDPNAMFAVPIAIGTVIASWWHGKPTVATPEGVIFYFSVFMTGLLESIATFGPSFLRLRLTLADASDAEKYPFLAAHDFGPKRLTSEFGSAASGGLGLQDGGARTALPGDDGLNRPSQHPAGGPPASTSGPASANGGAITINLHGGQTAPAATPLVPVVSSVDRQADENVALLRSVPPRLQITRNDPPAPAAPDAPTDRSALNAMLDSFVIFRAACVVDQPGTWLDAQELYAAYVEWAGARAQSAATFHTLFPATTSVPLHHVAGEMQYAGIGIKAAPAAVRA